VGTGVVVEEPRRQARERGRGGDHFDHLALGLANDVDPPPRHGAHKALALELSHRFTHGRAADAEIQCEPPLVEPDVGPAAIDVHRDDGVLERGVGPALVAIQAPDALDARRYRGSRGMKGRLHPAACRTSLTSTATHCWYTIFHGFGRCNTLATSAAERLPRNLARCEALHRAEAGGSARTLVRDRGGAPCPILPPALPTHRSFQPA